VLALASVVLVAGVVGFSEVDDDSSIISLIDEDMHPHELTEEVHSS
jgi:hypothetical protein